MKAQTNDHLLKTTKDQLVVKAMRNNWLLLTIIGLMIIIVAYVMWRSQYSPQQQFTQMDVKLRVKPAMVNLKKDQTELVKVVFNDIKAHAINAFEIKLAYDPRVLSINLGGFKLGPSFSTWQPIVKEIKTTDTGATLEVSYYTTDEGASDMQELVVFEFPVTGVRGGESRLEVAVITGEGQLDQSGVSLVTSKGYEDNLLSEATGGMVKVSE